MTLTACVRLAKDYPPPMPRPKLGNVRVCLRLSPSVDAALVALAESVDVPNDSGHVAIGRVCVDALRWFADREGVSGDWPDALEYPTTGVRRVVKQAVKFAALEARTITRGLMVPPSVVALYDLRERVDAWPAYKTRTKWNAGSGQLELAQRHTPASDSLVIWVALVEYLGHLAELWGV